MSKYSYRPLNVERHEIRLLKLTSSTDVPNVEIIHVSLDENPKYVALSYAWGDPTITKRINIVDRPPLSDESLQRVVYHDFQATTSLESALRHVRDADLGQEESNMDDKDSPLLWADAICINQNDDTEKGDQVRLMARIYSQCSKVCIWLGEAGEDSDLVMDMVATFVERLFIASASSSSEHQDLVQVLSDAAEFALENSVKNAWALIRFFWRPWWLRLWIIQEIVLSPSDMILCGSRTVEWSNLVAFLPQFYETNSRALRSLKTAFQSENPPFAEVIDLTIQQLGLVEDSQICQVCVIDRLKNSIKIHGNPPFRALLRLAEGRGYSDTRDSVYAILSLTNDAQNWEVEYGRTRLEVFECATKQLIKAESSLDIICHSRFCMHQSQQYMTWVPRFDYEILPCECRLLCGYSLTKSRSETSFQTDRIRSPYAASKSSKPGILFDEKHGELKVCAIMVDKVKEVFEKPSWHTLSLGWTQQIPDSWFCDALGSNKQQNASSVQSLHRKSIGFDEFWRTMVANRVSDESEAQPPLIWGEVFQAWLEVTGGSGFTAPLDVERLPPELMEHKSVLEEFSTKVGVALAGYKTLITTEHGRLGLGRIEAEPGDTICVMMGCSVPMIVRPVTDHVGKYLLIGESYIHGIMDGEVMDDLEAGKYTMNEIVIV